MLFLKAYKIKSVLSVYAQISGCLLKTKIKVHFLLASFKALTILNIVVPKAASEFMFRLTFSLILQCTCHGWLSEQFSRLQAAYGKTFSVTSGYRKAGRSF
jgi:hypothetical protein